MTFVGVRNMGRLLITEKPPRNLFSVGKINVHHCTGARQMHGAAPQEGFETTLTSS